MARYIDADAFIRILDAKADMAMGTPKAVFLSVAKMVDYLTHSDVAPKSEVAREIFEEIEKIIDKHHGECYEYEDGDECDTAITYISYISCDIDELKKKYTEEKE